MTKPACTMVATLPKTMLSMEAANMTPADLMTPPVEPTVLMTPEGNPSGD